MSYVVIFISIILEFKNTRVKATIWTFHDTKIIGEPFAY